MVNVGWLLNVYIGDMSRLKQNMSINIYIQVRPLGTPVRGQIFFIE
jgi:hypothetical protein